MYVYDPADDQYKDSTANFVARDSRMVTIAQVNKFDTNNAHWQMVITSDYGARQARAYMWDSGSNRFSCA